MTDRTAPNDAANAADARAAGPGPDACAPPEARRPPRTPLLYKIVSSRDVPPGYLMVACTDIDERAAFCVPFRIAMALHAAALAAEQSPAELSSPDDGTAATSRTGKTPPTHIGKPPAKLADHFVDTARLRQGWRRPPGAGWVQVWDPTELATRIDAHNAQVSTSDRDSRTHEAALFRQMVASGPWRRCAVHEGNPKDVVQALTDDSSHLPDIVSMVRRQVLLAEASARPFWMPPLLLVGEPGMGKSLFAIQLAGLLGLSSTVVDMSSQQTNGHFLGSDRHWANARPGLLFELIVQGETPNPLVVLDELDKAAKHRGRYDPLQSLHAILERTTAQQIRDQCMAMEFDASGVVYVATANSLAGIPESLLSRFHMVVCPAPTPRQALQIARRIAARVLDEVADGVAFRPVGREVLVALADRSPRAMERLMRLAVARAVEAGRREVLVRDLDLLGGDQARGVGRLH